MQKYQITGIKDVSFKGKDGNPIIGVNLYLSFPVDPENGKGDETEKYFISENKLPEISSVLEYKSYVNVIFNKYGKVDDIVDV